MTEISDMSLVSVLSVKGGTGKTTTTLGLVSLLAPEVPVKIIEGQRENPQYRSLLFPKNTEPEIIQVPDRYKEHTIPITCVGNSPVFQNKAGAENLSLILLNLPESRFSVEGWRLPVLQFGIWRTHRTIGDSELNVRDRSEKVWALKEHFDNEKDIVIVDYDAGLDRRTSLEVLPFHRAVNGYGVYHSILEQGALKGMNPTKVQRIYRVFTQKEGYDELGTNEKTFLFSFTSPSPTGMYDITEPYPMGFEYGEFRNLPWFEEEEYPEKDRFKRGLMIFVASPAVAEIQNLAKRSFFFRDLGPNNHYLLVINQARDEDVEEIDGFLRREMGDAYMFEKVVGLPQIPYMEFGNMITGGNPYLLPTYSDSPECREYTEKLGYLADYILSHV